MQKPRVSEMNRTLKIKEGGKMKIKAIALVMKQNSKKNTTARKSCNWSDKEIWTEGRYWLDLNEENRNRPDTTLHV